MRIFTKNKIIIAFEQKGCMGHIHDFLWIGYVIKEYKSDSGIDMYEVQPIKKGSTELRDQSIETEIAYQIQHLYGNVYAFYL